MSIDRLRLNEIVDGNLDALMQEALATGRLPLAREFRRIPALADWSLGSLDSNNYAIRSWFIRRYGFAVPCSEAVTAISSHGPVLEVGAGSGLWSGILSHHVDTIATDLAKGQNTFGQDVALWHPVARSGAAAAVKAYPGRTVLMVWPSYNAPWAAETIKAMKPGTVLAYIGEGNGGCTGDDRFHRLLGRGFEELDLVGIPKFCGLHDYLHLYRKKEGRT